jgi:hypothetical protein
MGFFRQVGLDPPPANGIPREAGDRFAEIRKISDIEHVDAITEELVAITHPQDGSRKIFQHILSETMNNVCQHSLAHGFSAAQYWDKTGKVQFCIGDFGCGLMSALTSRYAPQNDVEAIQLALRVGVTSRPPQFGQRHMRNRGVGLSAAHRLVIANHGRICVWSGRGWFTDDSAMHCAHGWTGTLIAVTMQRDNLTTGFRAVMDQLTEELRAVERAEKKDRRASWKRC